MLNKEICQRCIHDIVTPLTKISWREIDEQNWVGGQLFCPCGSSNNHGAGWSTINIHKDPPEYCPYELEHAVCDVK